MRKYIRYFFPKLRNIIFYCNYKLHDNKVSFNSVLSNGLRINHCIIEGYSYIGPNCNLNNVHVGRYSSIAPNVVIGGAEHSYWWFSTSHFISKKNIGARKTIIGNDVWIGANAVIRQGITIGNGAVVGAGSVVLKDIPSFTVVAGVPAKRMKIRFNEKVILNIEKIKFWDYPPKLAKEKLSALEFFNNE